jgi:hypothetical protein
VIKNVVVHVLNEQPLVADLYELPKAVDQGLLCTNLRTLDGRKPIFIDRTESVFFFPYLHIRFIEIPPAPGSVTEVETPAEAAAPAPGEAPEPDEDLELDEDFLRRIRDV